MRESPIDKRAARYAFERAAARYDEAAVLQREVADRLLEHLDGIWLHPRRILDLGCGTGYALPKLWQRFPKAQVFALDFAIGMLDRARRRGRFLRRPRCICGDLEALPLATGSLDFIFSNASFQWCNDLERAFGECRRVLAPGGLLLLSTFGPDTLRELRDCWARVDGATHVSSFLDMHHIGDALMGAGFAGPVMETERLTLTYGRLVDLMADLKQLGTRNATRDRPRGLTGRKRFEALERCYEGLRSEGRLPATYEVIYGHAWASQRSAPALGIPVASLSRSLGS